MKKKIKAITTISQTLIKQFKADYCAAQIKAVYIDKSVKMAPTIAMQRGIYFETQCIGGGAHGQSMDDLPRLRNGNKNAAHQRIDEQIAEFPLILKKHGINIKERQLKVSEPFATDDDGILNKIDHSIFLEGTIDFTGSINDDQLGPVENAVFDLKLTGSIYKEFGDWSWHFPHNMDHTQAYMYSSLLMMSNPDKIIRPFYYIVFDYAPESSYKIIRKTVDQVDLYELEESIRNTLEKMVYHEKNGWDVNPSFENCKRCPLKSTCSVYTDAKTIEVV